MYFAKKANTAPILSACYNTQKACKRVLNVFFFAHLPC